MLVGKPEGEGPLGELDVDGKIILEWILEKCGGRVWTGCTWLRWLRIGTNDRPL
jgi:hypothetical protein